jgi:4-amino-4-deoxychorismate lyase
VNLKFHQERALRSRKHLFGIVDDFDLSRSIEIPAGLGPGVYKCRMIYGVKVDKVEFEPYNSRTISTLKIVFDDEIDYSCKFADRSSLNQLYARRGDCDDVLIVKNNLVTDTFYSNILFLRNQQWFTPDKPLLEGVQRRFLIETGHVRTMEIRLSDIRLFEKFMPVNAMMPFDGARAVTFQGQNIQFG